MHNIYRSGILVLLALGLAFLTSAQAADDPACGQTIKTNCTSCHGINRICTKLDKTDADWKSIVATMAHRGNLPQATQDAAVKCLTATGAKQQVCAK